MRTVFILLVVVIIGIFTSQQGISGDAAVYQGGKVYYGWVDDKGNVVITNDSGRKIMSGYLTKTGGIQITDLRNSDFFEGRVSPMGKGSLLSSSGSNIRIELDR